MQVCKPWNYALDEAVEPFKLHPTSMWYIYERFEHVLRLWMGIWIRTHTIRTTDTSPDLGKFAKILPYASVQTMPLHFSEAVEPFKLHPRSMAYIYEVFERLLRMWMDIWLPTHTVTTTDASPNLGNWAEILPYASVQIMLLRFHWGCRTFQTAFHVHVIHIWEIWVPSQVVDGHMALHFHRYLHRCLARFVRVGWNPTLCKCANHATTMLYNLSNYIPCPCHTYIRCLSTF